MNAPNEANHDPLMETFEAVWRADGREVRGGTFVRCRTVPIYLSTHMQLMFEWFKIGYAAGKESK